MKKPCASCGHGKSFHHNEKIAARIGTHCHSDCACRGYVDATLASLGKVDVSDIKPAEIKSWLPKIGTPITFLVHFTPPGGEVSVELCEACSRKIAEALR